MSKRNRRSKGGKLIDFDAALLFSISSISYNYINTPFPIVRIHSLIVSIVMLRTVIITYKETGIIE